MAEARRYTDEEVKAIIERALDTQPAGEVAASHADLVSIGEQVGLSPAAIERAAEEVREGRLERDARSAITQRRRRWLLVHAAAYAVLNGLFFAVNALTTPGEWWSLFPIVIWGLALSLHAALALAVDPSMAAVERQRSKLAQARRAAERAARSGLRVAEVELENDANPYQQIDANSEGASVSTSEALNERQGSASKQRG